MSTPFDIPITQPSSGGAEYVGFQAQLTSTAGAAANPWKTWGVQLGDSSMWDSTTGKITIPSTGKYCFYVNLQASNPGGGVYLNVIFESFSGAPKAARFLMKFPQLSGSELGLQGSEVIDCVAGEEFKIYTAVAVATWQAATVVSQNSYTSKMGCFKVGN
tara:strand:+ start:145 stop:624 length:480 start_codon:yes stop_codon:yes gene_type:complete